MDGPKLDEALDAILDHLLPGRSAEIRSMTPQERKTIGVVAVEIEHMTAKTRTGPPVDAAADLDAGTWGGVLPVATGLGASVADGHTPSGTPEPASLAAARRRFA